MNDLNTMKAGEAFLLASCIFFICPFPYHDHSSFYRYFSKSFRAVARAVTGAMYLDGALVLPAVQPIPSLNMDG